MLSFDSLMCEIVMKYACFNVICYVFKPVFLLKSCMVNEK